MALMFTKEDIVAELQSEIDGDNILQAIQDRIHLCNLYVDSFQMESTKGLQIALEKSLQLHYPAGEMLARFMIAYQNFELGNIELGKSNFERAKFILDNSDIPFVHKSMGFHTLAYYYWSLGEYATAFDIVLDLLKQAENINHNITLGWLHYELGVFNYDLKDYETSQQFYTKAKEFFAPNSSRLEAYGIARSKTGIASTLIQFNKYKEATELLQEALVTFRELCVSAGVSRVLNDLASIEKKQGNFNAALLHQQEALKIRKETNHIQGRITSLIELGDIYQELGDLKASEKTLLEAERLAEENRAKAKLFRTSYLLSQVYKKLDAPWKALEYYEKYHELKEKVLGEDSNNAIKRLQTQFDKEKSEKEAEIERLRNVELKHANKIISEKNKEILDSINYAKRIQEALITNERYIEKTLKRLMNPLQKI
jgi:tetratricopeptide (TPR) repeat protein